MTWFGKNIPKSWEKSKSSEFPGLAALRLNQNCLFISESKQMINFHCVMFSDHMMPHFSSSIFALFGVFDRYGRRGTNAIYWWEKPFGRTFDLFIPWSWNWSDFLDTGLRFWFRPLWDSIPAFLSLIIAINHHLVLHQAKHGPMIIDSDIEL